VSQLALFAVLGLASWIITCVIVDSMLFAGMRRRVDKLHLLSIAYLIGATSDVDYQRKRMDILTRIDMGERIELPVFRRGLVDLTTKLKYLVGCHLCAGMWVSLAIAAFLPPVIGPWVVGWVLNGAIIKAVAHIVLGVQHALEAFTRSKETPEPPTPAMSNGGFNGGKQPARLTPFNPATAF
jgi:hypothetical protein